MSTFSSMIASPSARLLSSVPTEVAVRLYAHMRRRGGGSASIVTGNPQSVSSAPVVVPDISRKEMDDYKATVRRLLVDVHIVDAVALVRMEQERVASLEAAPGCAVIDDERMGRMATVSYRGYEGDNFPYPLSVVGIDVLPDAVLDYFDIVLDAQLEVAEETGDDRLNAEADLPGVPYYSHFTQMAYEATVEKFGINPGHRESMERMAFLLGVEDSVVWPGKLEHMPEVQKMDLGALGMYIKLGDAVRVSFTDSVRLMVEEAYKGRKAAEIQSALDAQNGGTLEASFTDAVTVLENDVDELLHSDILMTDSAMKDKGMDIPFPEPLSMHWHDAHLHDWSTSQTTMTVAMARLVNETVHNTIEAVNDGYFVPATAGNYLRAMACRFLEWAEARTTDERRYAVLRTIWTGGEFDDAWQKSIEDTRKRAIRNSEIRRSLAKLPDIRMERGGRLVLGDGQDTPSIVEGRVVPTRIVSIPHDHVYLSKGIKAAENHEKLMERIVAHLPNVLRVVGGEKKVEEFLREMRNLYTLYDFEIDQMIDLSFTGRNEHDAPDEILAAPFVERFGRELARQSLAFSKSRSWRGASPINRSMDFEVGFRKAIHERHTFGGALVAGYYEYVKNRGYDGSIAQFWGNEDVDYSEIPMVPGRQHGGRRNAKLSAMVKRIAERLFATNIKYKEETIAWISANNPQGQTSGTWRARGRAWRSSEAAGDYTSYDMWVKAGKFNKHTPRAAQITLMFDESVTITHELVKAAMETAMTHHKLNRLDDITWCAKNTIVADFAMMWGHFYKATSSPSESLAFGVVDKKFKGHPMNGAFGAAVQR